MKNLFHDFGNEAYCKEKKQQKQGKSDSKMVKKKKEKVHKKITQYSHETTDANHHAVIELLQLIV